MLIAVPVIISYLIGAIPFGLIITRLAGICDIRQLGSKNIGATNVWRVAGFKVAVWVYLGDILKGVTAVLIGRYFVSHYSTAFFSAEFYLVLCALSAIIGHIFPVYLNFKGGKGVNTALGAVLTLLPIETIIAFAVFVVVVSLTRFISVGSMLAALSLPVILLVEHRFFAVERSHIFWYLTIILALLIIYTHRKNIVRLKDGNENRFSFKSKKDKVENNV